VKQNEGGWKFEGGELGRKKGRKKERIEHGKGVARTQLLVGRQEITLKGSRK
jgi:hypothetical protein